jgi:ferredoxin-NADP reductase
LEKIKLPMTENIYSTQLIERHWLSKKAFEFILARPPGFNFQAGQRIQLFHSNIDRDYSLVSAPSDSQMALCIRNVKGGAMSSVLSTIDIPAKIEFTGPHGYFIFQSSPRPRILVATGTGIAPYCSMVRSGIEGFTLLHGVEKSEELYYATEIKKSARLYVPCLSGAVEKKSAFFHGRVTDYLQDKLPVKAYDFYLCGRREMIRDVTLLADERFAGSHIYTELFY